MAKVKIQGNAAGSGVFTVTAPISNTNRTLTLPDTTGTLLDENSSVPAANLTGTLPAISGANLTNLDAADVSGTHTAFRSTGIDDNAGSLAITINSSEQVGIGQTSPSYTLDVYKSAVGNVARFNSSSGNRSLNITSADNGSYLGAIWKRDINSAGGTHVWSNNGTERMRIDSAGNVGIGASVSESNQGSNSQALFVGSYSALINSGAYESCNLVENAYIGTASSDTWKYRETSEAARHEMRAGYHYLKVGVSGTADTDITWVDGIVIKPNGGGGASTADISMGSKWAGDGSGRTDFQTGSNDGVLCRMSSSSTASKQRMWFVNSNGLVGSVSTNGSATVFATSSDYRLKENVNYDWDATTKIKQLKPARFNFIADDTTVIDGFIAHEVQEIVPEAVTGTKDEMRDEEYEVTPAVMDGEIEVTPAVMGTRSVPYYQGIDQAKLVPLLVKTIQELEARITAGGL